MDLLTKEEGLQYLQDVLFIHASEVPNFSDPSVPASVKLSFLETVIRAFLGRVPFQSISLMSHDVNSRRRPSWNEIKRDLLLGQGGLCYWQNAFMYALLTSLELNAGMSFSTFETGIYCPDNHLIVLLHDLVNPGSLHLVDVGLGYFIPRAIPLDFKMESPEYTDSFMTYKFERESENVMHVVKKVVVETQLSSSGPSVEQQRQDQHTQPNSQDNNGEDVKSQNNSQESTNKTEQENQKVVHEIGTESNETIQEVKWQRLHSFNPLVSLNNLEPFFSCFDICFSDITKLSSHTSPRAMFWPNGRFVGLVNSKLIQEDEAGKLTKTIIIEAVPRASLPSGIQNCIISSNSPDQDASKNSQNGSHYANRSQDEIVTNGNEDQEARTCTKGHGHLHSYPKLEPLVKAYEQYFPQFPQAMVQAALYNWVQTGSMFTIPQHLA